MIHLACACHYLVQQSQNKIDAIKILLISQDIEGIIFPWEFAINVPGTDGSGIFHPIIYSTKTNVQSAIKCCITACISSLYQYQDTSCCVDNIK
jgi:hypothetical protein